MKKMEEMDQLSGGGPHQWDDHGTDIEGPRQLVREATIEQAGMTLSFALGSKLNSQSLRILDGGHEFTEKAQANTSKNHSIISIIWLETEITSIDIQGGQS